MKHEQNVFVCKKILMQSHIMRDVCNKSNTNIWYFFIVYIAYVCLYFRCQDRHPQQWEEDSSGYGHQRTKRLSAKEETGWRWVKRRLLSVTSFRCHFLWDVHITVCLSAKFIVILRTHSNAEEYLDDEDSDWEKSSTNEVHSFLHSFQHKPLYVYRSVEKHYLQSLGGLPLVAVVW